MSKSFIGILIQLVLCILYPGSNLFVVAGTAEQGAKIATDKLTELSTLLPRLKQEVKLNNKGEIFSSEKDYNYSLAS